jgi:hypothetical protein
MWVPSLAGERRNCIRIARIEWQCEYQYLRDRSRGKHKMTEEELDQRALQVVALLDDIDAGRKSEEGASREINRIFDLLSDEDLARVHALVAKHDAIQEAMDSLLAKGKVEIVGLDDKTGKPRYRAVDDDPPESDVAH